MIWRPYGKHFGDEILSGELVEVYATPYVKAEAEGEHTHYGHGLWIEDRTGGLPAVYVVGSDAGVSFKSSVNRDDDRQVTVISNTTNSAWAVLRDIESA